MENINIETTHNVLIDYKPAGVGYRIGAYFIDLTIKVIFFFMNLFLAIQLKLGGTGEMIYFIIAILLIVFYDLYMEMIFHGQSFGKMAVKIKVLKLDGTEPAFSSYILRWMLSLADVSMTGGALALISIAVSKNSQRIGDIAANTTVVRIKENVYLDSITTTPLSADYKTNFPEVRKLNDKDINVIKDLLKAYTQLEKPENLYDVLTEAKYKIMLKMGIESTLEPYKFLNTVLYDYNNEFSR